MKKNRIFLGGTCADTTWRDDLIIGLKSYDCEWFNPVVKDWTPECQIIEEDEKNNKCNVHLYVLTPEMKGVYSIAEIINSCWQAQVYGTTVDYVIFCVMGENYNWSKEQIKSLEATMKLCKCIAPDRCFCKRINSVVEILDILTDNNISKLK
jgi:PHP family Zn ribbon phosphoesterase